MGIRFFLEPSTLSYEQISASWYLLQRVYSPSERTLSQLIFGSDQGPMPKFFRDPTSALAQDLIAKIDEIMIKVTFVMTSYQWKLKPKQIDQLTDMQDPRIAILRQMIRQEVDALSLVQELQTKRAERLIQVYVGKGEK